MDIGAVWYGVLCDLAIILRPSMASCFGYEYWGLRAHWYLGLMKRMLIFENVQADKLIYPLGMDIGAIRTA